MMHPAFAARRGTRPRGEANLLAIITSKHVSWSNGPAGRPVSNSWPQGFVPALFFSSYFRKRKKDGRRQRERKRKGEREGGSNSIASCSMHAQALYGCEKASLSSPLSLPSPVNPPLTIRTVEPGPGHQTGPDMPCCAAEPVYVRAGPGAIDRSPQPWDNVRLLSILVQSDTRYTRAYDFPRRFLFLRIIAYIYSIYIFLRFLLRFHFLFIFFFFTFF